MTLPQHTYGWADIQPTHHDAWKPLPLTIAEEWIIKAIEQADSAFDNWMNGVISAKELREHFKAERIIACIKEARYNAAQVHNPSSPLVDHDPVSYEHCDHERGEIRVYWACKRCGVEIEQ